MRPNYLSIVVLLASSLLAQSPDFSNTPDYLRGRRNLLTISDLVIAGTDLEHSALTLAGYSTNNIALSSAPIYSGTLPTPPGDAPGLFRSAGGRFFSSPVDSVAVVTPGAMSYTNPMANTPISVTLDASNASLKAPLPDGVDPFRIGTGDWNGDGYADLAMVYNPFAGPLQKLVIASASDTTKPSQPKFGPSIATPFGISALLPADLNGDGNLELIGFGSTDNPFAMAFVVYTVSRDLVLTQVAIFHRPADQYINWSDVAVGRFRGGVFQQLVVVGATSSSASIMELYSFDDQFKATLTSSLDPKIVDVAPDLVSGRLIATSPLEHLVMASAGNNLVLVYEVDPGLGTLSEKARFSTGTSSCLEGLALTNLDRLVTDALDPTKTQPVLDRQIVFLNNCQPNWSTVQVGVIALNSDFTALRNVNFTLPAPGAGNGARSFYLVPADLQGRSVVLGSPTKIELNDNIQTNVVVAAPPSHVDFIAPAAGQKPTVLNISAMPEGFHTSYNTSQKSTNQSDASFGSSWGFSAKETVGASYSYGDLDAGDGFKLAVTATATQETKSDSDQNYEQYSTAEFDVSASTYTGDTFWFTSTRLNLWAYPVLGQTICPKSKPGCVDADKVPLTIIFSGPDNIDTESTSQDSSSIYQPPWEYGNVLSYPNNPQQFAQLFSDRQLLSSANQPSFSMSGGNLVQQANWGSGSSAGAKSATTSNYSMGLDVSAQGAVGFPEFGSVGVSADLDISGSYGLSSQASALNKMDTSTGLAINRPDGILDPVTYGYSVTPYIFGRAKPAGIYDISKQPDADINTFGAIRSAFTADVASSSVGGFWRQAYGALPDIGLSHRSRWKLSTASLANPIPTNCRPSGSNNSQQNCFDAYPHTPDNPWMSPSLHMQGFFITNAQPGQTNYALPGSGPNLSYTIAGTNILLQARVYNFSLAELPGNAQVHVQFYGMPWNSNTNLPSGPSFKIGPKDPVTGQPMDVVLPPIPAVSSGPSLNWMFAGTTFDTTAYANQYLVFWVVVWAETGTGSARTMIPEIAGHGLTALPPDSIGSMSQTPVEMNQNVDGTQMVTYSNNLGFYRNVFYVSSPQNSPASGASAPPASGPKRPQLRDMDINTRRALPHQPVEVTVSIAAPAAAALPGGMVRFYDGHPEDGGKLISVEHIGYVRANEKRQLKLLYHPARPGLRRIWAILNKGKDNESSRASRVLCVGKSCFDGGVASEAALRAGSGAAPDPRERP